MEIKVGDKVVFKGEDCEVLTENRGPSMSVFGVKKPDGSEELVKDYQLSLIIEELDTGEEGGEEGGEGKDEEAEGGETEPDSESTAGRWGRRRRG